MTGPEEGLARSVQHGEPRDPGSRVNGSVGLTPHSAGRVLTRRTRTQECGARSRPSASSNPAAEGRAGPATIPRCRARAAPGAAVAADVTAQAQVAGHSDDDRLVDAVRRGDVAAYGDLYARHVDAARDLARRLSRTVTEADDLVSEAFIRVLEALRTGGGPDSAVRAYLLTVLRNTAYSRTRAERRVAPTEDVTVAADAALVSVPFDDRATAAVDKSLAAKAFARLPRRWRDVLWLTEIAGQSPAQAAPRLGLTPNGVSALAYRAREALRQGYLQAHVSDARATRCAPALKVLGAWTRNGVSERQARAVGDHLRACDFCRALSAELAEINGSFRAVKAFARFSVRRGNHSLPEARRQRFATGTGLLSVNSAS